MENKENSITVIIDHNQSNIHKKIVFNEPLTKELLANTMDKIKEGILQSNLF